MAITVLLHRATFHQPCHCHLDLLELECSSSASPQISNPATPRSSEIPEHWHPEVEECIHNQSLEESSWCEIVRTHVSLLFSRLGKPTLEQCGSLAWQLILKHPFMKDDMGNGYVSGNYYMVCRCGMSQTTPSCKFLHSFLDLLEYNDMMYRSFTLGS